MTQQFFNDMAASWDEGAAERGADRLSRMAERLNIIAGSMLLDVGVGTAVFTPYLLERVGESGRIISVDFAGEMLRKAQAKGFKDVAFLCADVTSLPLASEVFDAAACYSSFPHFQDKPAALKEMHRVIKPGGSLFICHTSSRKEINKLHRRFPAINRDIIPDEAEMQALLSTAGFTSIKIEDASESYLCHARKLANGLSAVQAQG